MTSAPQSWLNAAALPTYHGGKGKFGGKAARAKLSANENPLGASRKARAAFRRAAKNLALYPGGEAQLVGALAARYTLPPETIFCAAGSGECLRLLAHAFLRPGDEAVMRRDGFSLYRILTLAEGAAPIMVAAKDWQADVDGLLAAVGDKTKMLLLANPDNPTGSFLDASALQQLHARLPKRVLLVLDGAYAEFADDSMMAAMGDLATTSDNVVMVRTFSKLHGLAGLRLGWACASPAILAVLRGLRLPYAMSAPAVAAGIAALGDDKHQRASRVHSVRGRLWLRRALQALGLIVPPSAANFLLIKFPSPDAAAQAWKALAQRGILLRHLGEDYGMADCLRVSIGRPADHRRLVKVLAALQRTGNQR